MHLRQIALVFACRAGGGSHHVAKIVMNQPGHHGVQIDHANALAGCFVQQHIVDFGVVVGDPLGQVRMD